MVSHIYTLQNILVCIKFFQPYKCILAVKPTIDDIFLSCAFQGNITFKIVID